MSSSSSPSILETLLARHPMPDGASSPELFTERVQVGRFALHLVGSSATLGGGTFTGSAAAMDAYPFERAFFELQERLCIGAAKDSDVPLVLRSAAGEPLGTLAPSQVFEPSPFPKRWCPALSNGVAAGASWASACDAALAEAIERDAILRSWYGALALEPLPTELRSDWDELRELYELELRCVHWLDHWTVVGVGFPRESSIPLGLGYGARRTLPAATQAARGELLQRLGFLFGEELPVSEPEVTPNAGGHQERYLWPGSHDALRRWLEPARLDGVQREPLPEGALEGFVDLGRPEHGLQVARAWYPSLMPMVFGTGYYAISDRTPHPVHPIA